MGMEASSRENNNEAKLFKGYNWTLPSDIDLVVPAQKALLRICEEAGWTYEEVSDFIDFSFRETFKNSVAHGNLGIPTGTKLIEVEAKKKYKKNPTSKQIHVSIKATKDKITVIIHDEGEGFKPEEVPDPTLPANLGKEMGRGLLFVRAFASSVRYGDGGRKATLTKERIV